MIRILYFIVHNFILHHLKEITLSAMYNYIMLNRKAIKLTIQLKTPNIKQENIRGSHNLKIILKGGF